MTISLLSLSKYTEDLFAARWLDDEFGLHFEFNALHDATGKPIGVNREGKAPKLTAEQLSTAQPFQASTGSAAGSASVAEPVEAQHPAYALATKGTAVRPDWANRYEKAAQLVEAGQVRLTGPETAVVSGSSDTYSVSGDKCHCKWMTFHSDPCSHYLAARMARALNQPIEPSSEAEKEAACAARRQANKDAMAKQIAGRGENKWYQQRKARRHNGEGARIYWRMAAANGRTAINPEIARRAQPVMNGGNK